MIHPFRDGNGRAIREFIRQLVGFNNYEIIFPIEKIEYQKAMLQSPFDTSLLEEFFRNHIHKT